MTVSKNLPSFLFIWSILEPEFHTGLFKYQRFIWGDIFFPYILNIAYSVKFIQSLYGY